MTRQIRRGEWLTPEESEEIAAYQRKGMPLPDDLRTAVVFDNRRGDVGGYRWKTKSEVEAAENDAKAAKASAEAMAKADAKVAADTRVFAPAPVTDEELRVVHTPVHAGAPAPAIVGKDK